MKNILNLLGVIATGVVIAIISDYIKNRPVIDDFLSFVNYAWIVIAKLLTYPISLWVVLILFVIIIIVYKSVNLLKKQDKADPSEITKEPHFLKYTNDDLIDIKWKWEWKLINGEWTICNLIPICPKDGTPLYQDWDSTQCPRCNYKIPPSYSYDIDKVKLLIADNASRKLYPGVNLNK